MEHVILLRWANGTVSAITDADPEANSDKIHVFPSLDDAVACAEDHPLLQSGQSPYQIVCLDEL